MIEASLHPELAARLSRGVALFRERSQEIERTEAHTYRVPSCAGEGHYLVYLDLKACTCPDHPTAKALGARCKHFYAAEICAARRRAAEAPRIGGGGLVAALFPLGRVVATPGALSLLAAADTDPAEEQGSCAQRQGWEAARRGELDDAPETASAGAGGTGFFVPGVPLRRRCVPFLGRVRRGGSGGHRLGRPLVGPRFPGLTEGRTPGRGKGLGRVRPGLRRVLCGFFDDIGCGERFLTLGITVLAVLMTGGGLFVAGGRAAVLLARP